jgi:hypothetical protein
MYEYITKLQPYFFSLREISDKVSLDLKIPIGWSYNDIAKKPEYTALYIQLQDENEEKRVISIISVSSETGYIEVYSAALDIITTNMEEEEKIKLFNEKMIELKDIFLKSSLDTLKDISFTNNEKVKGSTDV